MKIEKRSPIRVELVLKAGAQRIPLTFRTLLERKVFVAASLRSPDVIGVQIDAIDVTFNTGRKYTARGQVIRARSVEGGAIFSDFSRGIVGRVEFPGANTVELFARAVLDEYDAGRYRYDFDAANLRDVTGEA